MRINAAKQSGWSQLWQACAEWFAWFMGEKVRTERDRNNRTIVGAMTVFLGLGTTYLIIFARSTDQVWAIFARLSLIAGATFVSGALVGFLFSIPRALRDQDAGLAENIASTNRRDRSRALGHQYGVNTNLELVSDWLTKILVGVGLTQLYALRSELDSLAGALAQGLKDPAGYKPIIAATILYYVVGGFLVGYLLTRLFLTSALSLADEQEQESEINRLIKLDPHLDDLPADALALLQQIIDNPNKSIPAPTNLEQREMLFLLQQHHLVYTHGSSEWDANRPATLTPIGHAMEQTIRDQLKAG